MIHALDHHDLGGLASYLAIDEIPIHSLSGFKRLEGVIPGFASPIPAYSPASVRRTESFPTMNFEARRKPAPFRLSSDLLSRLELNAQPAISLRQIKQKVKSQEELGGLGHDGRMAYYRMELGFRDSNLEHIVAGIRYLKEDQRQSPVDITTYNTLRYMELKRKLESQISRLATTEQSEDIKRLLNQAIGHISEDNWAALEAVEDEYFQTYNCSLLPEYFREEITSYCDDMTREAERSEHH